MSTPNSLRLAEAPGAAEWKHGVSSVAHRAAMTKWYPPTDANPIEITREFADNAAEVNGQILATKRFVRSKMGSVARTYNMSAEVMAMQLARILGTPTTSSASSAQSEVWQLKVNGAPASGRFMFTLGGRVSSNLAIAGLSAAQLTSVLSALAVKVYGAGSVLTAVAAGANYNITASGTIQNRNLEMPSIVVTDALDTGSLEISTTTPGRVAGVRTHNFRWPNPCTLYPPTFAVIEAYACGADNGTWNLYPGMGMDSLSVDISQKDFIELSCEMKAAGLEYPMADVDGAWTPVSAFENPTYLLGAHTQLWVGANADTYAAADQILYHELRNAKFGINAGLTEPPTLGGGTHVQAWQYGEGNPDFTFEITTVGDKSNRLYAAAKEAEYGGSVKARLLLDPHSSPQRRFEMYAAELVTQSVPKPSGNENQLTVTFMANSNTTNAGPAEFWVETAETAYNVAL